MEVRLLEFKRAKRAKAVFREPPTRLKSHTARGGNAANDTVNFVVDMVENDCSGLVLWLKTLPSVAHQPIACLLSGESAHVDSMVWKV
jgi:hypothetical protein